MLRHSPFSIILFACLSFCFLSAVHAEQQDSVSARKNGMESVSGKITNVINTDTFIYVEVDNGNEKVWVAGPAGTAVKKGEMISFSKSMMMNNFHSKTLGRDFSVLYITSSFSADKTEPVIAKKSASTNAVGIGDFLREASLDGLDGKTKTFSAFKGKPLIINIWASWCGPCRAEMGSLQRLTQRYNGKEFNIIGISIDDYRDKAIAAIRQEKITFENFIDHNLVLENMLGAKTIPLTILVAADGRVMKKINGARTWDSPEMITTIGRVLKIKLKGDGGIIY